MKYNDCNRSYSLHPLLFVIVLFLCRNWNSDSLNFFLLISLKLGFNRILYNKVITFSSVFNSFGVAYRLVISLACLKYSSQLSIKSFPACSLSALSGKGTIRRHFTTSKMLQRDQLVGFQSFFNVFTQISPFQETLGWNILVIKNPNFTEKVTFRGIIRKIILNCEFATEASSFIRSTNGSFNLCLYICDIGFI